MLAPAGGFCLYNLQPKTWMDVQKYPCKKIYHPPGILDLFVWNYGRDVHSTPPPQKFFKHQSTTKHCIHDK